MALTTLENRIDAIRERAKPIKDTLDTALDKVRNDGRLTPQAKRQEIAQHYLAAKQKLEVLLSEERTTTAKKRDEVERNLFGQRDIGPAGVVAYRDAQDRALRLGPDDEDHALALLISARISRDDTLATAVLSRALHFEWVGVIGTYTDNYPHQREPLEDLTNIDRWTKQQEENGFDGYGAIYSVTPPREIGGNLNDAGIQKIATGELA
ncbi:MULTISPECIES: hypothetical protein [unclassified Microbacterium]|uniref:hypothetical protein n=1 Tax=unclassified Microbacterium TaxID=2609290 RepID=UPI001604D0D5|nr:MULTISPECIES: hypothetical protein [unclassified Microbacterium]QNA92695.1 hypothetical protein G4G29_10485 [Microbacterium sp. Se63.02b]QYM62829.1 hypothetical protein K1X59_10520 [Microbacterium sp. Se5.02b]